MELKGKIIVYSVPGCPHCKKAKSTLSELNLPFVGVDLERHPELRDDIRAKTSKTSVPQIFFNNIHIGGNDDLQSLIKDASRWEAVLQDVVDNEFPSDKFEIPTDEEDEEFENVTLKAKESEQSLLIKDFKASNIIKTNSNGIFCRYKNSFSGRELVNWLIVEKHFERKDAIDKATNLMNQHFFHHIKNNNFSFEDSVNAFYRLLEDEYTRELNSGILSNYEPVPASILAEKIRRLILAIYNKYLSDDGKHVDYAGISNSSDFKIYMDLTIELQRVDVISLNREEKLAFFINIYNALVIHINVSVSVPTNMIERYKFFNCNHYIIGGYKYSLQDIENGVLRGNKKGAFMVSVPFKKNDPRLKVALLNCEPLIHFALVCGAKSCPPIKTYSAQEIDNQLILAAMSFLETDDAVKLDSNSNQVGLSQIFKWYKDDFGKTIEDLLRWIYEHMNEGEKRNMLGEIMQSKNRKINFLNYDWAVNS